MCPSRGVVNAERKEIPRNKTDPKKEWQNGRGGGGGKEEGRGRGRGGKEVGEGREG